MYNIELFFKIKTNKNKKKINFNSIGVLFLLNFIFKKSKIKLTKIFSNKYLMIKSPFHYKVSKKLLYNKQGVLQFEIELNKKITPMFFEKF